jgi:drug/metabolite transporter (DMT)-like permease
MDLLWGAAGGLFGAAGLGFLYYGIGRGIVAVVSPLSALIGALIPMIFGLLAGEMPSPPAWFGAVLCLPATALLSLSSSSEGTRGKDARGVGPSFLYGVLAGIGFGGFFITVSRSGVGAGIWPLLSARFFSIMTTGAFAIFLRSPISIAAGNRRLVLVTGALDMGANIAFLLASRSEMLILVTIVTSLFPAPTVLLARIFMGQKLGLLRTAGLCMAVAGIALIGLR